MTPGAPIGPDGALFRRHIVLIGAMAVGKSAIGQELARALQREFVDTDQLIVSKHGSIAQIFAGRGELFFREVEAKMVAAALEATTQRPRVISLGGGAVLDSGTQQLLAGAWVVHLDADLDTVRERIRRNSGRPLLTGDPMQRWEQMSRTRLPVYQRLADATLDVRHGSVPELAAALVRLMPAESAAPGPDPRRSPGHPSARNALRASGSDSTSDAGPEAVPEDGQQ
ncbi:shikimate kinase [Paenarthrobacter sp. Z7-10]|uniref:shikimate kinase n=1 Tax=Paenarthrobacter sp. Z7-10 TaxID=2787635 RepID=UPI0022A8E6CC|nr:shikimate kinase [Paenarthrobacter sp. Z7-10]MCZ2402728.1 shikimate kinase [Paenarthrobacter sp. Z7-10]